MEKRINIDTVTPEAYKAMYALEGFLAKAEISKTLKELIKIRASLINSCAFCIDMHTKDAIKNGETSQRLFLISAWHESPDFFTEEEQIVLTMTEEITLITNGGLSDNTYRKALQFFSEKQIAEIIMAIVTINAWNRIAISTKMEISK
jgi:AhpD family alkylhydroperoxidase